MTTFSKPVRVSICRDSLIMRDAQGVYTAQPLSTLAARFPVVATYFVQRQDKTSNGAHELRNERDVLHSALANERVVNDALRATVTKLRKALADSIDAGNALLVAQA